FHDVVPGSSINMVYRDSDRIYKDIFSSTDKMRRQALASIYGSPDQATDLGVLNTTGWMRSDIVAIPVELYSRLAPTVCLDNIQVRASDGAVLVPMANVPGFGMRSVSAPAQATDDCPVTVMQSDSSDYVLENRLVRVAINGNGQIVSYYDKAEHRELVPKGAAGNVLELYDDVPLFWDAWDIEIYHLEKSRILEGAAVSIVDQGPHVASLSVRVPISDDSELTQTISLSSLSSRLDFACDVDWHENRKCLKAAFTWDIHSDMATYETQFGVVQRPTHRNTSWDMAKFEVCAHKFADLSEYGYGVALLNDSKYGHSTLDNTMSLSLLRAPKGPDEECDMGRHSFRYAVYPHAGTFAESNVVQEAYQFNVPLVQLPTGGHGAVRLADLERPFFSVSGARNVVLDTVKRAEDDENSYIVRLYEAYGGHARALLTTRLPARDVVKVNILENPVPDEDTSAPSVQWLAHSKSLQIQVKPFEIVTLKFSV
ncbi:Glycoside hydrolase, 38 vacuolar alpha mannosidase, partial [Coemansia sp. RSA 552]